MRLFTCPGCRQLLYFENVACVRCGATLGFLPDALVLTAFRAGEDGDLTPIGGGPPHRPCRNGTEHGVCNWMVPADDPHEFCRACRLNRTIPDLNVPGHVEFWRRLETEKRRLVYGLLRLGLPVEPRQKGGAEGDPGLAFDFLADREPTFDDTGRVLTGHARGVITLNIAEADPAIRERMRTRMAEPYRTILGHFRHESGHYYWDRLVRDGGRLESFRALFGDERQDYREALERHHEQGPPADWSRHFVSAYASSHPWEDWAESWSHYLHIVDTLETAWQFGLRIGVRPDAGDGQATDPAFDPYAAEDHEALVRSWLPVTYALNSLNRSMGHAAAYPFVLTEPVIARLGYVHGVVRRR